MIPLQLSWDVRQQQSSKFRMALESFKPLDAIVEPDERHAGWSLRSRQTGATRPLTIDDFHGDLAALTLNPSVPEDIQNHFLTARHLALYSWFVYRFAMAAQLQAYASLEYALRERFKELGLNAPGTLRGLLEFAAARGFLENEHFRDWPGHEAHHHPDADSDWLESWIRRMPEIISYFRNDMAHGSFTLTPHYSIALRFAADAINQLYPT
jgi:hypothetical protein